ncbi:MAG: AzlD domain-containing protein, partial [Clostridiales bacterium]|nr:AzlD domain-containing protein [Clostridiales bacterium]
MRIVVLIFGMALVTYIPRAIPAVLIDKMRFGKKAEQFLSLIPYTAMTALIFPGILKMDANSVWMGVVGGLTAVLLAWKKLPVMVVVLGSVVMVMLA